MDSTILAGLVAQVIKTNGPVELAGSEKDAFYRNFENKISSEVEQIRAAKRHAYEEAKDIAIR